MLTRLPSGPSGSTIAGILLFGLISRNAGAICSPLVMLTGTTLYGSSIFSHAIEVFRAFGLFQVWNSMVICLPVVIRGLPLTPSPEPDTLTTNRATGRLRAADRANTPSAVDGMRSALACRGRRR